MKIMKNFELKATFDNVLETYKKDMWGRNVDVRAFVELLNSIEESCSIAIDARWGSGKTFFVKQVKMVLDAFNVNSSQMDEETRDSITLSYGQSGNAAEVKLQPQVAVYYDAWANDNDEDPVLSLVYAIMQSVNTDFNFKNGVDCLSLIASIAEVISGRSITAIREALEKEDPMEHLRSQKDLHAKISDFLDSVLPERGNRLVVFVDELDRCKPTFAVRLLERIKHYFDNDRITFVFSVNATELQHTIKKHYGNDFNATRYLDRFFDIPISLPPIDMDRFYRQIGLDYGGWLYEHICKSVADSFNFTPREAMKFYKMARAAAFKPNHQDANSLDFAFGEGRARRFGLMFIIPIMIGLRVADFTRYANFVDGKDSSPMQEILAGNKSNARYYEDLLSQNETFSEKPFNENEKTVKLEAKLEQVYYAIFVHNYESRVREITVGSMEFGASMKKMLLRTMSTLSSCADYNV